MSRVGESLPAKGRLTGMRVSVDEWGWGVRVSCVNRKIGAVWRFSLLVSGEVVASWVVRSQARP